MRTYSILFLDIDGTLLDSRHRIMPQTHKRLQQLHRRGIPIVLCSARPPEGVELVAKQAGLRGPVACYNGGLIFDENRTILRSVGIENRLAVEFKRFAAERFPDVVVSAYLYQIWLTEEARHPLIVQEAEISGCVPVEGSLEKTGTQIHKLLCMGEPMRIRALQKEAALRFPELMALRSKPTYLEILPGESTKGSAARVLLEHYGLSAEQAVAFGDSDVDVDLLKLCGLGVAMGNAPRSVQEAADHVTASNDQEGICIALRGLRLKPPEKGFSL